MEKFDVILMGKIIGKTTGMDEWDEDTFGGVQFYNFEASPEFSHIPGGLISINLNTGEFIQYDEPGTSILSTGKVFK